MPMDRLEQPWRLVAVALALMRGVQEVLEHLVLLDDGEVRVSKLHDRILCRGVQCRSQGRACELLWNWAIRLLGTVAVLDANDEPDDGASSTRRSQPARVASAHQPRHRMEDRGVVRILRQSGAAIGHWVGGCLSR